MPDRDGRMSAYRTCRVMISDINEALQHAKTRQHHFRRIVLVWMCTPDGLNIYFNQRWVEYTGLTLEESYGRGWNTPFHPDDKQAAWDAWNHAVQTGEEYRVESRLRAADGRYRWFLMRGAPLRNAAQEIVRWFGTCTDIEELKQAEQTQLVAQRRLTETVVNQLPCCVALVRGRDMTFQLVNPGYQATFPGQEMLGNGLQVVWPEIPGFEERCRRVLETGVPYEAVDERNYSEPVERWSSGVRLFQLVHASRESAQGRRLGAPDHRMGDHRAQAGRAGASPQRETGFRGTHGGNHRA